MRISPDSGVTSGVKAFLLSLVLLVLAPFAQAQFCVPYAYTQLSALLGQPVSYEYWTARLMPGGKSPDVAQMVRAWNDAMPRQRLVCTFSRYPPTALHTLRIKPPEFGTGQPMIWVGDVPESMIVEGSPRQSHAAIAYLWETYVDLISPMDPAGSRMLVERLTYEEFLPRTHLIYAVQRFSTTKWRAPYFQP